MWIDRLYSYKDSTNSKGMDSNWANILFALGNLTPAQFVPMAAMFCDSRDAWIGTYITVKNVGHSAIQNLDCPNLFHSQSKNMIAKQSKLFLDFCLSHLAGLLFNPNRANINLKKEKKRTQWELNHRRMPHKSQELTTELLVDICLKTSV